MMYINLNKSLVQKYLEYVGLCSAPKSIITIQLQLKCRFSALTQDGYWKYSINLDELWCFFKHSPPLLQSPKVKLKSEQAIYDQLKPVPSLFQYWTCILVAVHWNSQCEVQRDGKWRPLLFWKTKINLSERSKQQFEFFFKKVNAAALLWKTIKNKVGKRNPFATSRQVTNTW